MNYGCKKEIEDKRDYKMKVTGIAKAPTYPDEYQIKMPRIKNQGAVNSCVAHSLSTFLEECYKNENQYFSVGFIYGYRPEEYYQGEGMYPREALKTLQKVGDVKQNDFPYNKEIPEVKNLVDKNIERLEPIANNYKIDSYARIYTKDEIKKCLYNDCPVPISIPVYNNLSIDKDGIIKQAEGEIEGYHMVILYGWNEKGYLLQNSWGITNKVATQIEIMVDGMENTVAVGDSANDIPMFEYTETTIGIKSDKTDVLKLVDIVTDTVLEDGVCHGLQKIGLI